VEDLVVRPWTEDDAPALEAALATTLEHLRPWMAWAAGPPPGVEWRREWIREQNAAEAAGGDRCRGFLTATGEVAGAGGLHHRVGPRGWELGYWVHAGFTRRGVATAAVARLVAEAFADPEADFVAIHHDVANVASGAVARAAGFTVVDEVARAPAAPADTGTDRRWRLTRAVWASTGSAARARRDGT
jgi:RimJ/RimL family protein N-acetyltransferase